MLTKKLQQFTLLVLALFTFSVANAQVLEYVGMEADSLEGRPYYSTMSSDGVHFYICNGFPAEGKVLHYVRNISTGTLVYANSYKDGVNAGNL